MEPRAIGASLSALAPPHSRQVRPNLPRSTAEVTGPYAVQGFAHAVPEPVQLQMPLLASTQADPAY